MACKVWPPFSLAILAAAREPAACLAAFLHNHWVGALLFAGLYLGYLLKPSVA